MGSAQRNTKGSTRQSLLHSIESFGLEIITEGHTNGNTGLGRGRREEWSGGVGKDRETETERREGGRECTSTQQAVHLP